MKQHLAGIVRLTRYREYIGFVAVTTLLGVIAARGQFGWPLLGVLVANWLAVGFAFMINDVEDAADDALNPVKVNRNPVSARQLSPRAGYAASLIAALLSAAVYARLGRLPFIIGVVCLALGFLYSWRPIRLKSIPIADLISHCLMLAGLQYMAAYVTFQAPLGPRFWWPFVFTLAVSMYGELYNEVRDFEGDRQAGVQHTASVLGARLAHWLMMALLAISIGTGLVGLLVIRLIPGWVLALLGGAAMIFLARPVLAFRRGRSLIAAQAPFHKPLEIATALALGAQVTWPWLSVLLHWPKPSWWR